MIAIDRFPERLAMAEEGGADTINYEEADVYEVLMQVTGGRGPDHCIDAVGMEALDVVKPSSPGLKVGGTSREGAVAKFKLRYIQ